MQEKSGVGAGGVWEDPSTVYKHSMRSGGAQLT